eukprot:13237760-Alexandrium_andersonii.AAC.1
MAIAGLIIRISLPGWPRLRGPSREAPPARPPDRFVSRFGICAKSSADRTPPELQGSTPRQRLGVRNSSCERLEHFR